MTPLGWCSQYRDPESDLIYLRARYYDPSTGQVLTRDLAVATTRSPYGYVLGDPLNASDPDGQSAGLGVPQSLSKLPKPCFRAPWNGDNGNGGCQTILSTSQGVTALGITIGIGAIIASGGSFAGGAFGLSSESLAGLGVLSGATAAFFDLPTCLAGNAGACIAFWLGVAGSGGGLPELGLAAMGGGSESVAAILHGLSIAGFGVGAAGTAYDIFRWLLSLFNPQASTTACVIPANRT